MCFRYRVYYDGQYVATVQALSDYSAHEKGCQIVGTSASAYSGKSSRLVKVERV